MPDLLQMFLALLAKTVTFGIAAWSLYQIGRWYDRRNSIAWKKVYDAMEEDPHSMALYFGLRILAFAVLAAWIYG